MLVVSPARPPLDSSAAAAAALSWYCWVRRLSTQHHHHYLSGSCPRGLGFTRTRVREVPGPPGLRFARSRVYKVPSVRYGDIDLWTLPRD